MKLDGRKDFLLQKYFWFPRVADVLSEWNLSNLSCNTFGKHAIMKFTIFSSLHHQNSKLLERHWNCHFRQVGYLFGNTQDSRLMAFQDAVGSRGSVSPYVPKKHAKLHPWVFSSSSEESAPLERCILKRNVKSKIFVTEFIPTNLFLEKSL